MLAEFGAVNYAAAIKAHVDRRSRISVRAVGLVVEAPGWFAAAYGDANGCLGIHSGTTKDYSNVSEHILDYFRTAHRVELRTGFYPVAIAVDGMAIGVADSLGTSHPPLPGARVERVLLNGQPKRSAGLGDRRTEMYCELQAACRGDGGVSFAVPECNDLWSGLGMWSLGPELLRKVPGVNRFGMVLAESVMLLRQAVFSI